MALILALLLAAAFIVPTSCGGDSGALVGVMKQIPVGAEDVVYWNVKEMEANEDLHGMLDRWKADNEAWLDQFSVRTGDVEHFLGFSTGPADGSAGNQSAGNATAADSSAVVKGTFDFGEIRRQLDNKEFDEGDFKGLEVWESPDGVYWVVLTQDIVAVGPKEDIIETVRVIEGGNPSLYDDQDARDVVDRLPAGALMHFRRAGESPLAGELAYGDSFKRKDQETLEAHIVVKFLEPEDAAAVLEIVEEEADLEYDKISAKQDGRYLRIDGEIDIEELTLAPSDAGG
jgi:hypothetical protein